MKEPFVRRPKAIVALAGLTLAVGLAVIPAQADSSPRIQRPSSTGTIGNGAAPGGPVTREQIIARAKDWVDQRVPYSQKLYWKDDATGGRYRQDCSGFVSMAWQLKDSLSTQTLPSVAKQLTGFKDLEPGDALVNTKRHALLFGGWTNKAKGDFIYYSESNDSVPAHKASANIHHIKIDGHYSSSYLPLRYKNLTTTAPTPPSAPAPARPSAPTEPVPSPPPTATAPPKPKPSRTTTPVPKASTTAVPRPEPTATAAPEPSVTAAVPSPDPALNVPAPEPSTSAPAVLAPSTPPSAPASADGHPSAAPPAASDTACAPARRTPHRFWVLFLPVPIVFTL
ncbi:NlpC/P60 family protein [Streptomyces xanthophaeus]|uniref:hypothetical protein n=1 Tax=Streptomyces xanthophaeus TaxID=67385 RepID=UPI003713812B